MGSFTYLEMVYIGVISHPKNPGMSDWNPGLGPRSIPLLLRMGLEPLINPMNDREGVMGFLGIKTPKKKTCMVYLPTFS